MEQMKETKLIRYFDRKLRLLIIENVKEPVMLMMRTIRSLFVEVLSRGLCPLRCS